MPSWYMTTPASGRIRSGADTFATITGAGSSSRGGHHSRVQRARTEGTCNVGCPGVDTHGRGSPPYGGSYSVGVLREPPPEMRRLVPYLAQGDSDISDPYAYQHNHQSTSCTWPNLPVSDRSSPCSCWFGSMFRWGVPSPDEARWRGYLPDEWFQQWCSMHLPHLGESGTLDH